MRAIRSTAQFLVILTIAVGTAWCQALKEVPSYALKRGDQAPPLGFEAVINGPQPKDINWQTLRGKVVVLDFWGTWCAPCVADIPRVNDLVSKYHSQPVQFIAVGHENTRKVDYFLKKHPIATVVDQRGIVAAVLSPSDLTEKVIDDVLAGRVPSYPALPPNAYWNPDTAAEYFIKVGQEEPPAEH
jgi:thiol-disulfide isomerase/thioredoxin